LFIIIYMMDNKNLEKNVNHNLINTFEEVKDVVQKEERLSRAGLMLGLQELGTSIDGFTGAYYPISSNIIVLNKTPIRRIIQTNCKGRDHGCLCIIGNHRNVMAEHWLSEKGIDFFLID